VPRFSVLTTVYNPPIAALRRCLHSVAEQTLADFEHVVVDDASTDPGARQLLHREARRRRTSVLMRASNGGIVAAAADAAARATGDFVVLLDHDDELTEHALERVAAFIDTNPHIDVVYSDHDMIRPDGRYADPCYKPDFSPERLRNHNYITHLVAVRRAALLDVGGFRQGFDGSQDHDLLLRLAERGPFGHIPEVLYHWRMAPDSVALRTNAKPLAYNAGVRAVQQHCDRLQLSASVARGQFDGVYDVTYAPLDSAPIVMTPEAAVEHASGGSAADADAAVVMVWPSVSPLGPPAAVDGDHPMVVRLAAPLRDPGVAVVGGALFSLDGRWHAAGAVRTAATTGVHSNRTLPILRGWRGDHPGYHRAACVRREVSALTAGVVAVRSADLTAAVQSTVGIGGSGDDLADRLCRWAAANGRRIVWTPDSRWCVDGPTFTGTLSSGLSSTTPIIDPFYNPNFLPGRADFLERPDRSGSPPYVVDQHGTRHWG
jgi:hypothetical protein